MCGGGEAVAVQKTGWRGEACLMDGETSAVSHE